MCFLCQAKSQSGLQPTARRRLFLHLGAAAAAGAAVLPAAAQVDVGSSSWTRQFVSAEKLEDAAQQEYSKMLSEARAQGALASDNNPQLQRLRGIARRIIPFATQWNPRATQWRWEVNLIGSKQVNAFCMPGGKIAFYTGILDQLKLNDDEVAMIMGHEMAHALREHARERMAKSTGTSLGLSLGAQLLGLGQLGDVAANLGTQLLTLTYSRSDETEADLVGLELAARAGFNPRASVTLWQKMSQAGGSGGIGFLSTHPQGPDRIRKLEDNLPKVQGLYEQSQKR
ncbi:M48 family metallopeptidase [Variovorax sp. HJSM1_2]|uniref:M48 family metallopeptidase n=1 Tax=Variovorax sp. HJSM1_2 TaxID=3366263 RepID=UPI003BC04787